MQRQIDFRSLPCPILIETSAPDHVDDDHPRRNMRSFLIAGLAAGSLLLALSAASFPQERDQLIVEKKAKYIPAGSGQTPFDVTRHIIRLDDIQAGGPPKNGIPALIRPSFVSASEADRSLRAQDMILAVESGSVAKAYPVRILNWHEVVNDDIGEQPVLITWCPLCGSGLAYDPRANGHRYTFGVSGLLYQQNLLFFDVETESLWSQLRGQAAAGPLAGTTLQLLSVTMTTWQNWRAEHPRTLVLSFQTGFKRDYSRDPYSDFPLDRRMALVISNSGQTKIYPYSELKKARSAVLDEIGGQALIIQFDAKQHSASIQAPSGYVPPHFAAFLGNVRPFFPNAEIYKAH